MPNCPHCNTAYIAGELYCSTCGHTLPAPAPWPPRPQEPAAQPPADQPGQESAQPAPEGGIPVMPQHLRLQLPSGAIIDLQGRALTVIGRKDSEANPDIDLAPYGAVEKGVSRLHAMFILDEGRYYIKDLESTNYTLLNAARLFPDQLYPLKHDDQLTLGDLEIRVLL